MEHFYSWKHIYSYHSPVRQVPPSTYQKSPSIVDGYKGSLSLFCMLRIIIDTCHYLKICAGLSILSPVQIYSFVHVLDLKKPNNLKNKFKRRLIFSVFTSSAFHENQRSKTENQRAWLEFQQSLTLTLACFPAVLLLPLRPNLNLNSVADFKSRSICSSVSMCQKNTNWWL